MKFARDCRSSESNEVTAQLLFEALPWIKNLTGKTVVIKYGGAAMVDEQLRRDVMSDIVLLKIIGMRPVIVHGGGKAINEALSHYDIPVEFKNGQRVTTPATMDIVREVLGGKVNQELVAALNHHGNLAVGVSGSDAGTLIAEPLDPELGRVGKVTHVNTDYIERLLDSEYIPVIATVAAGEDGGFFNINADTAAGAVAAALHAHKAIFLTDVDGLYKDFSDKDSLISNLTLDEVNEMLYGGEVDKGMIPKLRAAVDALTAGVFRAHIINGTTPHSLLLELLTDAGVGTVIHSTETAYEFDTHPHPLSTFAARLTENLDEVEKLQTVLLTCLADLRSSRPCTHSPAPYGAQRKASHVTCNSTIARIPLRYAYLWSLSGRVCRRPRHEAHRRRWPRVPRLSSRYWRMQPGPRQPCSALGARGADQKAHACLQLLLHRASWTSRGTAVQACQR